MPATLSLDVIDVARPCPADWNAMHGDREVRFCDHCQLNVYNLSEMTRPRAEQVLIEHEGHLCVRLYKRQDGTVITRDCGGGLKLAAKKLSRLAALSLAAVFSGIFAPFGVSDQRAMSSGMGEISFPVKWVQQWFQSLRPPIGRVMGGMVAPPRMAMGDVAYRPATQPATMPTTMPTTMPDD